MGSGVGCQTPAGAAHSPRQTRRNPRISGVAIIRHLPADVAETTRSPTINRHRYCRGETDVAAHFIDHCGCADGVGAGDTTAVGGDPEIGRGGGRGKGFQLNRKFDRSGIPPGQVGDEILLPAGMCAGGMRRA